MVRRSSPSVADTTRFVLAALVADVGALLFLLIAMPPAKSKPLPPAELGVRECVRRLSYPADVAGSTSAPTTESAVAPRPGPAARWVQACVTAISSSAPDDVQSTGVSKRHNENASVYGGYPERDYTSHRSSRRSRRGDDYISSRPRSHRSRRA